MLGAKNGRRPTIGFEEAEHVSSKTRALSKLTNTRVQNGNLRDAVRKPQSTNLDEWIIANLVDFYNAVIKLYMYCAEDADKFTKPGEGFPPRFEYRWANPNGGPPIECSATEYINYVLVWIRDVLKRSSMFTPGKNGHFGRKFDSFANKAFTRLFRVFAIIYHGHFAVLEAQDVAAELNSVFKHFFFFTLEHVLVDQREYKALSELCERLEQLFQMDSSSSEEDDEDSNDRDETTRVERIPRGSSSTQQSKPRFGRGSGKNSFGALSSPKHHLSRGSNWSRPSSAGSAFSSGHSSTSSFSSGPSTSRGGKGKSDPRVVRVIKRRSTYVDSMETLVKRHDVFAKLEEIKADTDTFGKACVDSVEEMLHSEMEFGELVWTIHDEFLVASEDAGVSETDLANCFVNIGEILRFSELLNVEMHLGIIERLSNSSRFSVSTVIKSVASSITPQLTSLRIYARFLAMFHRAMEEIKSVASRNADFGEIVSRRRDALGRDLFALLDGVRRRPEQMLSLLEAVQTAFNAYVSVQEKNGNPTGAPKEDFVHVAHKQWAKAEGLVFNDPSSSSIGGASFQSAKKALELTINEYTNQLAVLEKRTKEVYLQVLVLEAIGGKETTPAQLSEQLLACGPAEYRLHGTETWTYGQMFVLRDSVVVVEDTISVSARKPSGATGSSRGGSTRSILARVSTTVSNITGGQRKSWSLKQGKGRNSALRKMLGASSSSSPSNQSGNTPPSSLMATSSAKDSKTPKVVFKDIFPVEACSISKDQLRTARYRASEGKYSIRLSYMRKGKSTVLHFRTPSADLATAIFQFVKCSVPARLFSHMDAFEDLTSKESKKSQLEEALKGAEETKKSSKGRGRREARPEEDGSTSPPMPQMMGFQKEDSYDFFLSYHSSMAIDQALSLYLDLKNKGFRVWLDKTVESDKPNPEMIREGIRKSKVFLLLMKGGALLRHWIQSEVREARRLGKPIAVIYEGGLSTHSTSLKKFGPTAATPFHSSPLGKGDLPEYASDRPLLPHDLAMFFDEITAVPLQKLGKMRDGMWEQVLQQLRMNPPRQKSSLMF